MAVVARSVERVAVGALWKGEGKRRWGNVDEI